MSDFEFRMAWCKLLAKEVTVLLSFVGAGAQVSEMARVRN